MKVPRARLEQIIREELAAYLKEQLMEAPKLEVSDAHQDKKKKEDDTEDATPALKPQSGPDSPNDNKQPDAEDPNMQQAEPDPADDKLAADDAEDPVDDAEDAVDDLEEPGSGISDELVGKTVQSITMEPKSKLMPGAIEIVLTFDQVTDPLKILVNKSGNVKFFFKGLHNEL